MLLEGRKTPPFGQDNWLYEIKHDGYRVVAGVNGGRVVLNTRNGADATKWFPEIVGGLQQASEVPHIIDGEVCVLYDIGRSDFNRLQNRARRRRWFTDCDPIVFCAFDMPVPTRSRTSASLSERAFHVCGCWTDCRASSRSPL